MSSMPQWVPVLNNCLSRADRPHLFTLSTISSDQMPRGRVCVFRSWLFDNKSSGVIVFTTDKRMAKIQDLKHNDGKFEACFWFPKDRIQMRLSGFAQILSEAEIPNLTSPARFPKPLLPTLSADLSGESQNGHPHAMPGSSSRSSSPPQIKIKDISYYPVISPSFDAHNSEYDGELPAPSKEEWLQEYRRIWDLMSRATKATFRKPEPGSVITDEHRKRLDSIDRGVDGSSDDLGLENFLVILLFTNSVDLVHLEGAGKRAIYTRLEQDIWSEQEVCP